MGAGAVRARNARGRYGFTRWRILSASFFVGLTGDPTAFDAGPRPAGPGPSRFFLGSRRTMLALEGLSGQFYLSFAIGSPHQDLYISPRLTAQHGNDLGQTPAA